MLRETGARLHGRSSKRRGRRGKLAGVCGRGLRGARIELLECFQVRPLVAPREEQNLEGETAAPGVALARPESARYVATLPNVSPPSVSYLKATRPAIAREKIDPY